MPRNPDRISAIMRAVEAFWTKHPDLRFAQVLHCFYSEHAHDEDYLHVPYYEEEVDFSKRLTETVRKIG